MTSEEKIIQLRNIIRDNLTSLINSDYILLDVPYHGNIGDTFIWQGERDFLASLAFKKLEECSLSWDVGKRINKNITLLLHGGGNFGDLYRMSQEFRLKVISTYKSNPIILFPQSVWYNRHDLIKQDAKILAKHTNLTLCARDAYTYEFFTKEFPSANTILVPDMAFFINTERLTSYYGNSSIINDVYVRRIDDELKKSAPRYIENTVVRDWPTLETASYILSVLFYFNRMLFRAPNIIKRTSTPLLQSICEKYILKRQLKMGLDFLSTYSKVYTTRLHAMIGAILLQKPVEYIDNSTGKISSFAETWLKDLNNVKPYVP